MHRNHAIGLAAAALLALPAVTTAEETPSRPVTGAATHAQALEALRLRSEALNRLYGHSHTTAPSSSSEGFAWTDAGLGAGAGFGLALLGGASAFTVRRRRKARVAHP